MKSYRDVRLAQTARIAVLVLASALATGCASYPASPAPGVLYPDYLVGAPDSLAITVLPEPAISETAIVRPDGKITIQLIGDVHAGGRTPREIGIEIEERIARFKRGARATVSVLSAASSTITVFGEIRSPGTIPIFKQTRVAEALGSSGGPTPFANLDGIHIVRNGSSAVEVIPVDLGAIRQGDMSTNVQLLAGDIVFVPPTMLARIGYGIQQILFPFQPLLGVAQSSLGFIIAK